MDSNQIIQEESLPSCQFRALDFSSILEITGNDPDPPLLPLYTSNAVTTVNPSDIVPLTNAQQENAAAQNVNIETAVVGPLRQRRKSVPAISNIQHSPMTSQLQNEESIGQQQRLTAIVKTGVKSTAAVSLNETEGRSRHVGASSTATTATTTLDKASSSNVKHVVNKKLKVNIKRIYEMDDPNDRRVKNAKAAKKHREKIKMQMVELENRVDELTAKNDDLQQSNVQLGQEIEQRDQEIYQLRQLLQTEQEKNLANSKQKVTMFDLIKRVVSVVRPIPSVIYVTDRLAKIPMPDPSEMDQIRNMDQAAVPSGNSIDLTFQVGIGGNPSLAFDCQNKPQH